ncbi:MAG: tetratricopeptide repeat protein, partial [Sediminibacterium sp.]
MKDEYKKSAILFCFAFFFLGKSILFAQTFAKDSIDQLLTAKGLGIERIRFLNNIAEILSDKNTELAINYANLALTEAVTNNQPKEKGIALNNLAWIKYRKGDFTSAFDYSIKALKWNDSIQNLPALAASYRCLASVYNSQGNANKSIEFFLKDLTLHSQLNDQKSIGRALNNLSFTFLRGQMIDSAILYSNKALSFNLKLKDDYLIAFAYRNAGDLSEARKLQDSAKYYFNLSIQYATKINSLQLQLTALYRTGRILNHEEKYNQSIPILEKALNLGISMGAKSETALIYSLLEFAYEGIGNYKEAYQIQKKSSLLNDSLYQEKSRSRLAEMQAKFEAEKKQSEINQLRIEKELEIENNQRKTILNFSL